jgi:glucokinase
MDEVIFVDHFCRSFQCILSADIGGTNSRFAVHEIEILSSDSSRRYLLSFHFVILPFRCIRNYFLCCRLLSSLPGKLILNKEYRNSEHDSFDAVMELFLKEAGLASEPPLTACIAVAGPVKDNIVRFTNRDGWIIAGRQIAERFRIKSVQLVNDFLAAGYGILTLNEKTECVVLQDGVKNPSAPIACIGAGTGLGECFLTPKRPGDYVCYPSEGGHAEFAPRNEV